MMLQTFSDHLLVKCALHLQDENGSSNQACRQTCDNNNNNQYFRYIWPDVAKQQYYISTGNMLQLRTADLNSDNMCLTNYEFVNRLYNGIVGELKYCSTAYYKSFIQKPCYNLCWSHNLDVLKKASKDALSIRRNNGCPVVDSVKDALVTPKRNYKKALKSAKCEYRRVKAESLRDSCLHGNSNKFWNIVNTRCKAVIYVKRC